MWEPRGVVWDIQIVLNAFITVVLELGVDGGIDAMPDEELEPPS